MRRVLFASTLCAALGSLVTTLDQARANDFVCIRTSKGKVACGSMIRHSDKALLRRHDKRQHIVPLQSDEAPDPDRRNAKQSTFRDSARRNDDVDPRFPARGNRYDRDGYRRRSSGTIGIKDGRPYEPYASVEMPRPNPLRPTRSDSVRRSHPKRIVFKSAPQGTPVETDPRQKPAFGEPGQSRRGRNFSRVPPGRNASRDELLRSIDRALSSDFGRKEQPPPDVARREQPPSETARKVQPPSAFARKEQPSSELARKELPRRVVYPDLRPYRDDARQPDVRSDPLPDDQGKRPDQK